MFPHSASTNLKSKTAQVSIFFIHSGNEEYVEESRKIIKPNNGFEDNTQRMTPEINLVIQMYKSVALMAGLCV